MKLDASWDLGEWVGGVYGMLWQESVRDWLKGHADMDHDLLHS